MSKVIDFEKEIDRVNTHNRFMANSGIRITELSLEYAVAEVEITEERTNIFGKAHGGLICTLVDCAAGVLARSDGRGYVTSDMTIKFISNVNSGVVSARAAIVSRGRKICNLEVSAVEKATGKLLAQSMVTYYCVIE